MITSRSKANIALILFILQLVLLISIVGVTKYISVAGTEVKIQMSGYDPYDFLRGRYLSLTLENRKVKLLDEDVEQYKELYQNPTLYVILEPVIAANIKNVYTFAYASLSKPPKGTLYIQCKGLFLDSDNMISIYAEPLEKYYVNEKLAPKLENIMSDETSEVYLTIKVLNGKYAIDHLTINGADY